MHVFYKRKSRVTFRKKSEDIKHYGLYRARIFLFVLRGHACIGGRRNNRVCHNEIKTTRKALR